MHHHLPKSGRGKSIKVLRKRGIATQYFTEPEILEVIIILTNNCQNALDITQKPSFLKAARKNYVLGVSWLSPKLKVTQCPLSGYLSKPVTTAFFRIYLKIQPRILKLLRTDIQWHVIMNNGRNIFLFFLQGVLNDQIWISCLWKGAEQANSR